MEFSKYQKEVFNFVNNGNGNAVISAVAGSGKTTTIVNAAKLVPSNKKVLFLAFNKNIVEELSQRLQSCYNVKCSTSHAHGLQAIKKVYKYVRIFNGNRFFKDVTQCSVTESEILSVDSPQTLVYAFNKNSLKLLDLCRINLVKNGDIESIEKLVDMYNIEIVADEVNFVNKLLSISVDDNFSAIDIALVNLREGTTAFIKIGSPYGFVVSDKGIRFIEGSSLPLGILDDLHPTVASATLSSGDVIVMISDGVQDAFTSSGDLIDFLKSAPIHNPQELADAIITKAYELSNGTPLDDMSAVCVRLVDKLT